MLPGGQSNTMLVSASEASGATTMSFTRPLISSDSLYDLTIVNATMFLLWAYCPQDGFGSVYGKHTATGSVQVNFFDTLPVAPATTTAPLTSVNTSLLFPQTVADPLVQASTTGGFQVWWTVNATAQTITFVLQGPFSVQLAHTALYFIPSSPLSCYF